jgi:putative oxidoreductase
MDALFNRFPGGRTGVSLLFWRVVVGGAFAVHGLYKVQSPGGALHWMGAHSTVPAFFQGLATLAELGGGLALICGFLTPLAALGICCTMMTALWLQFIPNSAPWIGTGKVMGFEMPLFYLVSALCLLISGPGQYSLDKLIFGRKRSSV